MSGSKADVVVTEGKARVLNYPARNRSNDCITSSITEQWLLSSTTVTNAQSTSSHTRPLDDTPFCACHSFPPVPLSILHTLVTLSLTKSHIHHGLPTVL